MPGGKRDSFRTRVQPVFGQLLARCPDGSDWLPSLQRLPKPAKHLSAELIADPGRLVNDGDACYFYNCLAPDGARYVTFHLEQGPPDQYFSPDELGVAFELLAQQEK